MNPQPPPDKLARDIGYAILALVERLHPAPAPAAQPPAPAAPEAPPAKRGRGRPPGTRNTTPPAADVRPPGRPRQFTPEERRAKFNDYKKQWYLANAETIRAKAREARQRKAAALDGELVLQ